MLPGTTQPEQVFNANLDQMIRVERQSLESDRNDALMEAFNPNRFEMDMQEQVGKSLGVGDEFLSSEGGQKMLGEIANFLMQEQQVQKLEAVSTALTTLLNSMMVPQDARYPEGLAKTIFQHLQGRNYKKHLEREIDERTRVWSTKPY